MPDLSLDLRHLDCAIIAAEHGSFRRAAQAASISQSTLSRRIQLLEHRLGITLFVRSSNGCKLTDAGERFVREAAYGASHLRAAVKNLIPVKRGHEGTLRVALPFLGGGFVDELIASYTARFPGVSLWFEEASSMSTKASLLAGRVDAALLFGMKDIRGCQVRCLLRKRLQVILPTRHRLAESQTVRWEDIKEDQVLLSSTGIGPDMEQLLVRRFPNDQDRPEITLHNVGREIILNMVAAGIGITISPQTSSFVPHRGTTAIQIGSDDDRICASLAWNGRNPNPALRRLLEECEAVAARHKTQ